MKRKLLTAIDKQKNGSQLARRDGSAVSQFLGRRRHAIGNERGMSSMSKLMLSWLREEVTLGYPAAAGAAADRARLTRAMRPTLSKNESEMSNIFIFAI